MTIATSYTIKTMQELHAKKERYDNVPSFVDTQQTYAINVLIGFAYTVK